MAPVVILRPDDYMPVFNMFASVVLAVLCVVFTSGALVIPSRHSVPLALTLSIVLLGIFFETTPETPPKCISNSVAAHSIFITAPCAGDTAPIFADVYWGSSHERFTLIEAFDSPNQFNLGLREEGDLVTFDFAEGTASGSRSSAKIVEGAIGMRYHKSGDAGALVYRDSTVPGGPQNFTLRDMTSWGGGEVIMHTLGIMPKDCRTLVICAAYFPSWKRSRSFAPGEREAARVFVPLGVTMHRHAAYARTCPDFVPSST